MTRRPRLLDVYCGAGGAAMGYHRAGFDVVGIDNNPQPRYPFPFVQADALEVLADPGLAGVVDVIHTSPPCRFYSITRHSHGRQHPDLVGPTRDALRTTGLPYVIENVVGAPLLEPLTLCWSMFYAAGSVPDDDGTPLRMERHRLFESSVPLLAPSVCKHPRDVQVAGSYGGGSSDRGWAKNVRRGGYTPSKRVRAALLGVDWPMTLYDLAQAIPPAYTEHVGRQLIETLS